MWSYCVEFLDEYGGLVASRIVTAGGEYSAIEVALRGFTGEFADVEVTRLC